jgi:hypothetical protein
VARAQDYQDLICGYPWPCDQAMRVMRCESSGDPRAYNAGNYGLYQINGVHGAMVGWELSQLYVPEVNVDVAYRLYSAQGWGPWACRP